MTLHTKFLTLPYPSNQPYLIAWKAHLQENSMMYKISTQPHIQVLQIILMLTWLSVTVILLFHLQFIKDILCKFYHERM